MKRIWIVLTLYFILAFIIGATGCIKAPPASEKYEIEFRQTVWQINNYGNPVLKIAFTLSEAEIPKWAILDRLRAWSVRLFPENGYKLEYFKLTLIDQDGIEVASDIISSDVTVAKLDLSGNMPKAGQYRLIVREGFMGKIIATETLSFEGAEATISDVELTFSSLTMGHVDLRDIRYNIRNDGDIPVCFNKVKLVIGDKEISTMPAMIPKGVVLPKAEKTFHTMPLGMPFGIMKIKPGEYAANLELRDDRTDEVVCSYSFEVAPGMSHETEEVFYFEGAEATISDVELTWDYMENFEFYSLKRISFIVSNNGDLPAHIFEARIAIGDKVYPISPTMPFEVLPGETKTIEESLILTGITSGDKEFILELKDSTGKVVGSYSRNVTPTTGTISVSSTIIITGSVMWGSVPVPGAIVELEGPTGNVLSQAEVGADGRFKIEYTHAGSYFIHAFSPSDEYEIKIGKSITLFADQTIDAGTFYLSKKLKLLEPGNLATVSTATPTLRWMSFPDATRYHVDVFKDETGQAVLRQDTTDNSLIIAQPLASGVRYEWSVHAFNAANNPIAASGPWYFTVQT